MKYTIRHHPDVPAIESAHWQVWRPGMYEMPFRGFKAFATAPTLAEALSAVQADVMRAMVEFSTYTRQNNVDLVEAAYWWTARCRNDWRNRFFKTTSQTTTTAAATAPH